MATVRAFTQSKGVDFSSVRACVNLTPYDVRVYSKDMRVIATFDKSSTIARVHETFESVAAVGQVPVSVATTAKGLNLPPPADGILYLVSRDVAAAHPERGDLARIGPVVRGSEGIGCHFFVTASVQ